MALQDINNNNTNNGELLKTQTETEENTDEK